MRILAHRAVEKHDGTSKLREFLQQQRLMDKPTRQTIGRREQNRLKLALFCSISQAIQGRTIQTRSTVTLILIEMLRRNRPAFRLSAGLKTFNLLRNRL